MKKEFILTILLFLSFIVYSQDYEVRKLESITKGEYNISRLLVVSDSVSNTEIDKFITDFTSALKIEFERHELNFLYMKRGTYDVDNVDFILNIFNPDGLLNFTPSKTFIKSTGWRQMYGIIFILGLSYRQNGVKEHVPLFKTEIEVIVNRRIEKSVELAAKDFFNLMLKEKYLKL